MRITDAEDPEPRSAPPSKRFRQAVQQHRAHPREEHPDEARTNDPEAAPPPNAWADDGSEEYQAAHDPLGSGLAQRMLSTALGADPEEQDQQDHELGMHVIDPESDPIDDEEAPPLDSRELQTSRPPPRH